MMAIYRFARLVTAFLAFILPAISSVQSETRQVEGTHGIVTSPNFPHPYTIDTDITWNITVTEGRRIYLEFVEFDLENSWQCEADVVNVTTVSENKHGNDVIQSFCGKTSDEHAPTTDVIKSEGNNMIVSFHSDFSDLNRFTGFMAIFVAKDIDECADNNGGCEQRCHNYESGYFCSCRIGFELMNNQRSCMAACRNLTFTTATGTIESIDYPEPYPNNASCDWTISVEAGYFINFSFETMDIESHQDAGCPYDFLKIEADGIEHGPYCGIPPDTPLPPPINTTGQVLRLFFHSDSSDNQNGFRATYNRIAVPCPSISKSPFGNMRGSEFTYGEKVISTCNNGYTLVGSMERTCEADGTWSGDEASCVPVDCGELTVPENGSLLYYNARNFTYTNTIGYQCDDNYDLMGTMNRTCQGNGEWSPDEPTCVLMDNADPLS